MAHLKTCNPTLAKEVWQSMPNATTRRVARKLSQAGFRISHMTVARWCGQGWRPLEREPRHPLEIAGDHLDDAVPLLTGDPLTTATSFIRDSAELETLEQLTDDELQRRAAREVAICVYVVAKAMVAKAAVVVAKPAEVGILMWALAECVQAATAALAKRGPPRLHS
jgi:hypothetical protein